MKAAQATAEERNKRFTMRQVKSGSVTTAWYKAVEGYNTYPKDDRFEDAIEQAGSRSLNYADRLESKREHCRRSGPYYGAYPG
ncbi:MAG: hypothetical protein U5K84_06450 [Alkalibacterium sp.]|nr:hypothetical protein [Alkalibacterium sp.]